MRSSDLHINLWKNSFINDITFVESSYTCHGYTPHFHDYYVIMMVEKGINEGLCQKIKYRVAANELLILNPGEIHTGHSFDRKPLTYSGLYIEQDYFKAKLPEYSCLHIKNDKMLCESFKNFLKVSDMPGSQLEIGSAEAHFFELISRYSNRQIKHERGAAEKIKNALTFIHDNYKENFSLDALSGEAGLSRFHFVRSFKESIGITPYDYLRNYRIEKARQLIKKGTPIVQAALEAGFYDQSHFHKFFKQIAGITPGTYRRLQQ